MGLLRLLRRTDKTAQQEADSSEPKKKKKLSKKEREREEAKLRANLPTRSQVPLSRP